MTRTPDETKKGLEYCMSRDCAGVKCPYFNAKSCNIEKTADALAYMQQLESQNSELSEKIGELEAQNAELLKKVEQLKAERDAAVSELVGTCQVCRWEETEKCASCHFCEYAWNTHESNWEWRGVQKEE